GVVEHGDVFLVGVFEETSGQRDELRDRGRAIYGVDARFGHSAGNEHAAAVYLLHDDRGGRVLEIVTREFNDRFAQLIGRQARGLDFVEQRQRNLAVG